MINRMACAAAVAVLAGAAAAAQDRYIGEIITMGSNFCPRGTAEADGQMLPIAQNTALFSLYGTIYGGDGRTTFALPDLRGRAIVHEGQGPGLPAVNQGQRIDGQGTTRTVKAPGAPTIRNPTAAVTPGSPAPSGDAGLTISGGAVSGLGLKHCVVLDGIYPSRS